MNAFRSPCVFICLLCACAESTQPSHAPEGEPPPTDNSSHQAGPVGTKLVRDVTESTQRYDVGDAHSGGLGGYAVQLNGEPVWPPTGPACDKLVACCTALAATAKPLALSCLLATARDKTCSTALSTSIAIATEQSYPLPASCVQ